MGRTWTEKQLEAITSRGSDLLVSAAAGSGKTAVLVERITRLILEDRVPVTALLVVTFTKAAAGEMRERIQKSLRDALAEAADPDTEDFLREQLSELYRASITNFHSFAASLLREYFHVAGVDPAFRVADETKADLLKNDAMEELFETRFSAEGPAKEDFLAYLNAYGQSRSDDPVREHIRSVSTFLDSLPDPEKWMQAASAYPARSLEDFEAGDVFRFVCKDIDERLTDALFAAESVVKLLAANPVYRDGLLLKAKAEYDALSGVRDAFRESFDTGLAALSELTFLKFVTKKTEKEAYEADRPYVERMRAVYHNTGSSKGIIEQIRDLYGTRSLRDAHSFISGTAPYCRILTDLVREFRAIYRRKKDGEKLLDFADLEAYALEVLADESSLSSLRNRYRYIFVDEYQDSNRVQEELISRLKHPDNQLFFVGDVKQSIYRFRLAEPTLFNSRMKRYRAHSGQSGAFPADSSCSGKVIDLNKNFRSENSVLRATNALFENLMEPVVSGISYDETQALFPGTPAQEAAETPVELHIIDTRKPEENPPIDAMPEAGAVNKGDSSAAGTSRDFRKDALPKGKSECPAAVKDSTDMASPEDPNGASPLEYLKGAEAEAALAVELIRRDFGKPYVDFSTNQERTLALSDIVILLRANTSAPVFENALLSAGFPAVSDTGDSYFDTLEISVFLHLLEIIDNLHLDEPLIGVLHSALFRFSADDLARIRLFRRTGSFADALLAFSKSEKNSPDAGNPEPDPLSVESAEAVCMETTDAASGKRKKAVSRDSEDRPKTDDSGYVSSLPERVSGFLDTLKCWREKARFEALPDFLWDLMIDSGYYYYVGALPNGMLRQANLRALIEKAAGFEANGGKGLPGWIRFVSQMKKGNLKIPQVKANVGENAVRIMTIHKSKGLEFPYVILAETGKSMDRSGAPSETILRAEGILALPYKNKELHVRAKTLLAVALERMEKKEERAEELRVLYVAMTRAKHKLILLGSAGKKRMEDYELRIPNIRSGVMTASSYLDWMLGSPNFLSTVAAPVLHPLKDLTLAKDSVDYHEELRLGELENGFAFVPVKNNETSLVPDDKAEPDRSSELVSGICDKTASGEDGVTSSYDSANILTSALADFYRKLDERFRWVYPHLEDTVTQSKMTVTEINRKAEGKDSFRLPLAVPSFARKDEKRTFSGAEKGTYLHRVLEHIPFRPGWTQEGITSYIGEMVKQEFFTEEEAATVPPEKILSFFDSPIGKRAVKAAEAGNLFRETDFTLLMENGVVVQGTIDLFFRDENGWVLVDYKSNWLDGSDESEEDLLSSYRSQLLLYKKALEQIRGISVTETCLYAFSVEKALRFSESQEKSDG